MVNNKNELKVILTEDGSNSIFNSFLNETYHSVHGATQESNHVFIKYGLNLCLTSPLNILEVGLGSGLNAALTYLESLKMNTNIKYTGLEPFPLDKTIFLKWIEGYEKEIALPLNLIYESPWNNINNLSDHFSFKKFITTIEAFETDEVFNLIYFDAFSPMVQPDLWNIQIFKKLFNLMAPNAVLTTYSAKGEVKRNLKSAGFNVKVYPGPPGKREMTVALKA